MDTHHGKTIALMLLSMVVTGVSVAAMMSYIYEEKRKQAKIQEKQNLEQSPKTMECIDDYDRCAKEKLPRFTYLLLSHGVGDQATVEENMASYNRYCLRKRIFNDFPDMSTTILDSYVDLPIGIGPTMYRSWVWGDGDLCVSKAAGLLNICEIVPMLSDCSLEQIIEANQSADTIKWLQIYICDNGYHKNVIRRAEKAGYQCIVIASGGYSYQDATSGHDWTLALSDIVDKLTAIRLGNFDNMSPAKAFSQHSIRPTTWNDVKDLKNFTNLPIILMDIVTPEDAELAIDYGAQGIIVSNEGGKTVESLHGILDVLPDVVSAVDKRIEVYVYGGIRTGTDVMKALALGANACFVGRPVLYGLSYKGEEGAIQILTLIKDELVKAMTNTGCTSLNDIGSFCVVRSSSCHEDDD